MSLTFVVAAWYSAKVIHPWIILPFIADIPFFSVSFMNIGYQQQLNQKKATSCREICSDI